jgi:hypothetical protein
LTNIHGSDRLGSGLNALWFCLSTIWALWPIHIRSFLAHCLIIIKLILHYKYFLNVNSSNPCGPFLFILLYPHFCLITPLLPHQSTFFQTHPVSSPKALCPSHLFITFSRTINKNNLKLKSLYPYPVHWPMVMVKARGESLDPAFARNKFNSISLD